jgi:hypothetical protein
MAPTKHKFTGSNSAQADWTDPQLAGHELAKMQKNKMQAWWWAHGFPTRIEESTSQLFWCCARCNKSDESCKHVYNITKGRNGPPNHLTSFHQIEPSTAEEPSQTSALSSLERGRDLSLSVFRTLLLQWIVHDNVAFNTVDSERFKALLTYLEGSLEGNIGSRRSVRRWILDAYGKHAKVIKAELAKSRSLIHLSFDLWTSRSLLSLNGIVVHFVDKRFEPRTFLLALPEQEDEHTGVNIANTVRNLLTIGR